MRILVKYCRYLRNDGTFNEVWFDTDTKTYSNDAECNPDYSGYTFVETRMSRDVDRLRWRLKKEGYVCTDKER